MMNSRSDPTRESKQQLTPVVRALCLALLCLVVVTNACTTTTMLLPMNVTFAAYSQNQRAMIYADRFKTIYRGVDPIVGVEGSSAPQTTDQLAATLRALTTRETSAGAYAMVGALLKEIDVDNGEVATPAFNLGDVVLLDAGTMWLVHAVNDVFILSATNSRCVVQYDFQTMNVSTIVGVCFQQGPTVSGFLQAPGPIAVRTTASSADFTLYVVDNGAQEIREAQSTNLGSTVLLWDLASPFGVAETLAPVTAMVHVAGTLYLLSRGSLQLQCRLLSRQLAAGSGWVTVDLPQCDPDDPPIALEVTVEGLAVVYSTRVVTVSGCAGLPAASAAPPQSTNAPSGGSNQIVVVIAAFAVGVLVLIVLPIAYWKFRAIKREADERDAQRQADRARRSSRDGGRHSSTHAVEMEPRSTSREKAQTVSVQQPTRDEGSNRAESRRRPSASSPSKGNEEILGNSMKGIHAFVSVSAGSGVSPEHSTTPVRRPTPVKSALNLEKHSSFANSGPTTPAVLERSANSVFSSPHDRERQRLREEQQPQARSPSPVFQPLSSCPQPKPKASSNARENESPRGVNFDSANLNQQRAERQSIADLELLGRATVNRYTSHEAEPLVLTDQQQQNFNAKVDMIRKGEYSKMRKIGRGASGTVFSCLLDSGATIAMKEIPLETQKQEENEVKAELAERFKPVEKEVRLLLGLQHPNIVQHYHCLLKTEEHKAIIFMELVTGGSLGSMVRSLPNRLNEEVGRKYALQLLLALSTLHQKGVMHRDLKCDNVLLTVDGIIKLADFGTAKELSLGQSKAPGAKSLVGTPYFIAPEVMKATKQTPYGPKADIWSFGITISELLSRGQVPWPAFSNPGQAFIHIGHPGRVPDFPSHLSSLCLNFLQQCCARRPSDRWSAEELLRHPWLIDEYSASELAVSRGKAQSPAAETAEPSHPLSLVRADNVTPEPEQDSSTAAQLAGHAPRLLRVPGASLSGTGALSSAVGDALASVGIPEQAEEEVDAEEVSVTFPDIVRPLEEEDAEGFNDNSSNDRERNRQAASEPPQLSPAGDDLDTTVCVQSSVEAEGRGD